MTTNQSSVKTLHRLAVEKLATVSDSARFDADVLLDFACNVTPKDTIVEPNRRLSQNQENQFNAVVHQRLSGKPIAYITGRKEFWSLQLLVTTDTLIPRPETELLVETALTHLPVKKVSTVLELGTGSGAIALAIASERPNCNVIATDISANALDVARRNLSQHRLNNISFLKSDWFAKLGKERFDLVISNPPYIASQDPHLQKGDVRYEPKHALKAGNTGLDALKIIIANARSHLKVGGLCILEHGFRQHNEVHRLFQREQFSDITLRRDLAGHPRVTFATA